MDNSINLGGDDYFQIHQNLSQPNISFSGNIGIGSNINPMDIFNSPKKRNSMDLEISYTDEQDFENSNMFEVADQEGEEQDQRK